MNIISQNLSFPANSETTACNTAKDILNASDLKNILLGIYFLMYLTEREVTTELLQNRS